MPQELDLTSAYHAIHKSSSAFQLRIYLEEDYAAEAALMEQKLFTELVKLNLLPKAKKAHPFTSFADFSAKDFAQIKTNCAKKGFLPKAKVSHPHQTEAVTNIVSEFESSASQDSRALAVSPCGSGKSLIGYWAAMRLSPKVVCAFFPNAGLVAQTFVSWKTQARAEKRDFDGICVVSKDAGEITSTEGEVSTDANEVANFISDYATALKPKVVFSTYQSRWVIFDAIVLLQQSNTAFMLDFCIFDEAHHLAGDKDKAFAEVLEQNLLPSRHRLSMTGSPKAFSEDTKNCMFNEELFGKLVYKMTMREAIDLKILTPFEIEAPFENLDVLRRSPEARHILSRRAEFQADKKIDDNKLIELYGQAVSLLAIQKKRKLKKALVFHREIAESKAFLKILEFLFASRGEPGKAYHVDGEKSAVAQRILDEFKNSDFDGFEVMTNANYFAEGFDIPEVDAVQFASGRATGSAVIQLVGRATRLSDGKNVAIAIIPHLESDDKKITKSLEKTHELLCELRAEYTNLETATGPSSGSRTSLVTIHSSNEAMAMYANASLVLGKWYVPNRVYQGKDDYTTTSELKVVTTKINAASVAQFIYDNDILSTINPHKKDLDYEKAYAMLCAKAYQDARVFRSEATSKLFNALPSFKTLADELAIDDRSFEELFKNRLHCAKSTALRGPSR